MNIEAAETEPPNDETVLASVRSVEERVIAGIGINRRQQRRIRVGVGVLVGAGLFAGGIVVGAAALPPTPNPGANPGVTVNSQGQVLANQFAIDCYTSTSDTHPSEEDETGTSAGTLSNPGEQVDERDPAATCAAMQLQANINEALQEEMDALAAKGIDQGFIQVTGGHIYHFERGFGPQGTRVGWSFDDGVETTTPGIVVAGTIPLPAAPTTTTAVCAAASNWVKVYPRGTTSAAALCGSLGLQVWQSGS